MPGVAAWVNSRMQRKTTRALTPRMAVNTDRCRHEKLFRSESRKILWANKHALETHYAQGSIRVGLGSEDLNLLDDVVDLVLDFTNVFIVQALHDAHRLPQLGIWESLQHSTRYRLSPW